MLVCTTVSHSDSAFEHFAQLAPENSSIRYFVSAALASLAPKPENSDDVADVQQFFKSKDVSRFTMALEQACDRLTARKNWYDKQKDEIVDWMTVNNEK